jgi:hypothetical protein
VPTFQIRLVNRDFTSTNHIDADDPDSARTEALKGALQIGTEEICAGKSFFGAEICVERENGEVERMMVAIGASPLA